MRTAQRRAAAVLTVGVVVLLSGCKQPATPPSASGSARGTATVDASPSASQPAPQHSTGTVTLDPGASYCRLLSAAEASGAIGQLTAAPRWDAGPSGTGTCSYRSASYTLGVTLQPADRATPNMQPGSYAGKNVGPSPCPGLDGFTVTDRAADIAVCTKPNVVVMLAISIGAMDPVTDQQGTQLADLAATAMSRL